MSQGAVDSIFNLLLYLNLSPQLFFEFNCNASLPQGFVFVCLLNFYKLLYDCVCVEHLDIELIHLSLQHAYLVYLLVEFAFRRECFFFRFSEFMLQLMTTNFGAIQACLHLAYRVAKE